MQDTQQQTQWPLLLLLLTDGQTLNHYMDPAPQHTPHGQHQQNSFFYNIKRPEELHRFHQ